MLGLRIQWRANGQPVDGCTVLSIAAIEERMVRLRCEEAIGRSRISTFPNRKLALKLQLRNLNIHALLTPSCNGSKASRKF